MKDNTKSFITNSFVENEFTKLPGTLDILLLFLCFNHVNYNKKYIIIFGSLVFSYLEIKYKLNRLIFFENILPKFLQLSYTMIDEEHRPLQLRSKWQNPQK